MLIFYFENALSAFVLIIAAIVHESGHFIAIKATKTQFKRVDIEPFGATIEFSPSSSYKSEVIIALAGPIAGIFAGAFGWLCFLRFPTPHLLMFIIASLLLAFVNVIPLRTLDGGTALRALLNKKLELEKSELIQRMVSLTSASMLCIFSVLLLQYSGYNVSLLALTGFQLSLIFSEFIVGNTKSK